MSEDNSKTLSLRWQKIRTLSIVISSILIPSFLALIGHNVNTSIKERELSLQYVKMAVDIVKDNPEKETENLRKWAIETVNHYAAVKLTKDAKNELTTESFPTHQYKSTIRRPLAGPSSNWKKLGLSEKPDGLSLSKKILLIADNHLNHLFGDPAWLRIDSIRDFKFESFAPLQQDIFGQSILKWVLQNYGSRYPIIHLGDGTNLACKGEFESFTEIMSAAKRPWVMTPGNHDVYLLGNLHNLNEDWWENACKTADGPMTKDRFIREYLKHLKKQQAEFGKYLDVHPEQGEWRLPKNTPGFLKAVAWKINEEMPFRSYILQEIDLSLNESYLTVSAILLDSTQYEKAPSLVKKLPNSYNAVENGSILPDQTAIVEKWLKDNTTGTKITILLSHHPYGLLIDKARITIDTLIEKYKILFYISAHLRFGQDLINPGEKELFELNVGSMVDEPIEFRTLSFHEIRDNPDNILVRTKSMRIPDLWEMSAANSPRRKSRRESGDSNFYTANYRLRDYWYDYDREKELQLIHELLRIYKNLIEEIPSAVDNTVWPKKCSHDGEVLMAIDSALVSDNLDQTKSFFLSLNDFATRRKVNDVLAQRDYKLWQAVLASKATERAKETPVTYLKFTK